MTFFGKILRIYPRIDQQIQIEKTFDGSRYVWNKMLEMQISRYQNNPDSKYLNNYAMNYVLTQLKREQDWLKIPDKFSLQNANSDLNQAFQRFFKKLGGYPKFKSRKRGFATYTSNFVNNNIEVISKHCIKLPKLGYVKYRSSSIPEGVIKSVTVKRTASNKYYAVLRIKGDKQVFDKTSNTVGIDVGLEHFAITSDKAKYPSIRFDKSLDKKRHAWQKKLARRHDLALKDIKYRKDHNLPVQDILQYKNYMKARYAVAKLSEKERNQRNDYINKITTQLVHDYDIIVVEKLHIKNMMKNHSLSRAIGNSSWYEFTRQLEYKCQWYGKTLVIVNPYKTSQVCSNCGYDDGYHSLDIREWTCPQCGKLLDRDVNAAININHIGLEQALVK